MELGIAASIIKVHRQYTSDPVVALYYTNNKHLINEHTMQYIVDVQKFTMFASRTPLAGILAHLPLFRSAYFRYNPNANICEVLSTRDIYDYNKNTKCVISCEVADFLLGWLNPRIPMSAELAIWYENNIDTYGGEKYDVAQFMSRPSIKYEDLGYAKHIHQLYSTWLIANPNVVINIVTHRGELDDAIYNPVIANQLRNIPIIELYGVKITTVEYSNALVITYDGRTIWFAK